MALRRFWRFEDGEGSFGARLMQLRAALQNESLDFQTIRAALGGGKLSVALESDKAANASPANDKAGFDHGLAQQLVIGLKGISYFDQPALGADLPIAATPDTVFDMSALAKNAAAAEANPGGLFGPSNAAPQADDSIAPFVTSLLTDEDGKDYMVLYQPDGGLGGGTSLVIDVEKKQILSDWSRDRPELTGGDSDQLVLGGGMAEGSLGGVAAGHERIVFLGGSDYTLTATDADVGAGDVVAVIGSQLGGTNGLDFDGSAESDGAFMMLGGAGDDRLAGGSGDDSFDGGLGGDWLAGGAGADTFHYSGAADSTGAAHDTLSGFDFGADKIDLPTAVTGFDAAVVAGALSQASFDADLAAVLGAGSLGAGRAAWFTPNGGDLAGKTFLVVDGNGVAGYQAGEDYVFEMAEPPPADLSGVGFFV